MPMTVRRPPSNVTILAASLLGVAAGLLVLTMPLDVAYGQGSPTPRSPAVVVLNADVMVLLATRVDGRGSIDPAIGNLPQLREPPFTAFNSYHLLDKRTLSLPMGRSSTYAMPNGRVLKLTFVEPSAERGFRLKVAINRPGGNEYLKVLETTPKANEWIFVAGQQWHGGVIWIGIMPRP